MEVIANGDLSTRFGEACGRALLEGNVVTNEICVLVTGAHGCLGSWVVKQLAERRVRVIATDVSEDATRFAFVTANVNISSVQTIPGVDITDASAVDNLFKNIEITHVIHLAALQVPQCKSAPSLGQSVNIVGTVNVLEAARQSRATRGFVYASSIAVYGDPEIVGDTPTIAPDTLYGVSKVAVEQIARIYWRDHEFPTVGVRPYVVYGPGRDQGMTSAPTVAMARATAGEDSHLPFGGRFQMHYVVDVAEAFISAVFHQGRGAKVFDLGGPEVSMHDVITAITKIAPDVQIEFSPTQLPFPPSVQPVDSELWIPKPTTGLEEGIKATMNYFASNV